MSYICRDSKGALSDGGPSAETERSCGWNPNAGDFQSKIQHSREPRGLNRADLRDGLHLLLLSVRPSPVQHFEEVWRLGPHTCVNVGLWRRDLHQVQHKDALLFHTVKCQQFDRCLLGEPHGVVLTVNKLLHKRIPPTTVYKSISVTHADSPLSETETSDILLHYLQTDQQMLYEKTHKSLSHPSEMQVIWRVLCRGFTMERSACEEPLEALWNVHTKAQTLSEDPAQALSGRPSHH